MNKNKIEIFVYQVLIGALLVISISLILYLLNSEIKMFKLSDSFWGSLLGATITGIFAVYVMKADARLRKKEEKQKEKNNYKKSFTLIKMWHSPLIETIKKIIEILSQKTLNNDYNRLKQEVFALEECLSQLNQIRDEYIPAELYKTFLEYKAGISLVISLNNSLIVSAKVVHASNKEMVFVDNNFKNTVLKNTKSMLEELEKKLINLKNF